MMISVSLCAVQLDTWPLTLVESILFQQLLKMHAITIDYNMSRS